MTATITDSAFEYRNRQGSIFFDYAEANGFSLFPCRPGTKIPAVPWKRDSSPRRCDWESGLAEGNNLGINAAQSGLIILDIDSTKIAAKPDAWQAYAKLVRTLGIPEPRNPHDPFAPHALSARDGMHTYVRRPAGISASDLRGNGTLIKVSDCRPLTEGEIDGEVVGFKTRGYAVAPSSYYDGSAKGEQSGWYTLIPNAAPPHECPPALIELLQLPKITAATGVAGESDCEDMAGLVAFLDASGEFDAEPDWFKALGAIKLACGATEDGEKVALQFTTSTYEEFRRRWDRLSSEPRPGDYKVGSLIRRARELGWSGHVRRSAAAMFRGIPTLAAVDAPPLAPTTPGMDITGPRGEILPTDCDESLALSFAAQHADDMRYVEERGRWLRWDVTRWRPDRTSGAYYLVREHLRDFAGRLAFQDARKVASARTVAAVERMARTDPRIATEDAMWDTDPWLLNTPGGVVDLRTGAIRPAWPSDYMTKLTGAAPGGDCPRWLAFLNRSLGGDAELIAFLQRSLGYALTGITREHALFFLHGSGRNGKGVFLNTVATILGDYSTTAPVETFLASPFERHPTELAGLSGKRLVVANEVPQGRYWDEPKIKTLTGGDKIAARFMRQDFFEFTPQFKLIVVGNHKPRLRSVDTAMRRRMHLIPFKIEIPEHEQDATLSDRLQGEAGGILAWLVQGCIAWQKGGLQPPVAVQEATKGYLQEQDAMSSWIEECCDIGPDHWDTRARLFGSWTAWSTRAGENTGSRNDFFDALRPPRSSLGCVETKHEGVRGFRGIRTKTSVMPPQPPLPATFR